VVAALDLEFPSPPLGIDAEPTIRVLGHCAFAEPTVDGESQGNHIARSGQSESAACSPDSKAAFAPN